MTWVEVLLMLAVLLVLAFLFVPTTGKRSGKSAMGARCLNNLKQVGISIRVFQDDRSGPTPRLPVLDEPSLLYAWVLTFSNVLWVPKVLICPTDRGHRVEVTDWAALASPGVRNRGLSYFVGPDATELRPHNVLFGDRSIEARAPLPPFSYRAPRAVLGDLGRHATGLEGNLRWTPDAMHRGVGQVALADGSAHRGPTARLVALLAGTGGERNRIVQPGEGED